VRNTVDLIDALETAFGDHDLGTARALLGWLKQESNGAVARDTIARLPRRRSLGICIREGEPLLVATGCSREPIPDTASLQHRQA